MWMLLHLEWSLYMFSVSHLVKSLARKSAVLCYVKWAVIVSLISFFSEVWIITVQWHWNDNLMEFCISKCFVQTLAKTPSTVMFGSTIGHYKLSQRSVYEDFACCQYLFTFLPINSLSEFYSRFSHTRLGLTSKKMVTDLCCMFSQFSHLIWLQKKYAKLIGSWVMILLVIWELYRIYIDTTCAINMINLTWWSYISDGRGMGLECAAGICQTTLTYLTFQCILKTLLFWHLLEMVERWLCLVFTLVA